MFLDLWQSDQPPFAFKYHDQGSASFLSTWQRTAESLPSSGGSLHRFTFLDPATHLKIVAEVRSLDAFDATDWVLPFTNEGPGDTPILADIEPLHWALACGPGETKVRCADGSNDVELRRSLDQAPLQQMSGRALAHLSVSIPDQPGSLLIFYTKRAP